MYLLYCRNQYSLFNSLVITANGGKMPVYPTASISTGYIKLDTFNKVSQYGDWHVLGDYNTHLIFLSDIYDGFFSVMSIGDLFLRLFVVLIVYYSIMQVNNETNKIY
jgi:hypothetical protein